MVIGTMNVAVRYLTRESPDDAIRKEQGLARQLSTAQQTMMALGGAIGTGLFLASGLAVNVAGPAVILSYVVVAAISLLLGRALAEMAVAHPTAGRVWRLRGHLRVAVRRLCRQGELLADAGDRDRRATRRRVDLHGVLVPRRSRRGVGARLRPRLALRELAHGWRLGSIEYWLVMIKVVAIVLFVVIAAYVV
jgi:hypothetical protein